MYASLSIATLVIHTAYYILRRILYCTTYYTSHYTPYFTIIYRDVLKSDSSMVYIPELDLELTHGTLGIHYIYEYIYSVV